MPASKAVIRAFAIPGEPVPGTTVSVLGSAPLPALPDELPTRPAAPVTPPDAVPAAPVAPALPIAPALPVAPPVPVSLMVAPRHAVTPASANRIAVAPVRIACKDDVITVLSRFPESPRHAIVTIPSQTGFDGGPNLRPRDRSSNGRDDHLPLSTPCADRAGWDGGGAAVVDGRGRGREEGRGAQADLARP